MKFEDMDTLTATNMLFENSVGGGAGGPGGVVQQQQLQQQHQQLQFIQQGGSGNGNGNLMMLTDYNKESELGKGDATTATTTAFPQHQQQQSDEMMMMDLFNGSDIDLLEDILTMEELFPVQQEQVVASSVAASVPLSLSSQHQQQQQILLLPSNSPPSNSHNNIRFLKQEGQWADIEPTLYSPVNSVGSPPQQQQPQSPPATSVVVLGQQQQQQQQQHQQQQTGIISGGSANSIIKILTQQQQQPPNKKQQLLLPAPPPPQAPTTTATTTPLQLTNFQPIIAPVTVGGTATTTNQTFQKNIFLNVQQQQQLMNNMITTTAGTTTHPHQQLNPFANVFINQNGTVVAASTPLNITAGGELLDHNSRITTTAQQQQQQQQLGGRGPAGGTLIPTTAFGTTATSNNTINSTGGAVTTATNVFPTVILPQLVTVVDGKVPLSRLPNNNGEGSKHGQNNSSSSSSSSKMSKRKRQQNSASSSSPLADHGNSTNTVHRRSSHNAIERRYRSSINDKILELKSLVITPSDPTDKVHKAAILRSSIETIKFLQANNSRLEKENKILRSRKCGACGADQQQQQAEGNGNDTLVDLLINSPPLSDSSSNNSCDGGSPGGQSCSDGGQSGNSSPVRSPQPCPATEAMGEEKRIQGTTTTTAATPLVLFAVACGLFLINPGTNTNETNMDGGHKISKREVEDYDTTTASYFFDQTLLHQYIPRITAMVLNMIVFLFLYKVLGLFTSASSPDEEVSSNKISKASEQDMHVIAPPTRLKRLQLLKEYLYTLFHSPAPSNPELAEAYIRESRMTSDPLDRQWMGLKIVQCSMSIRTQESLLSGLVLVNSKIMARSAFSRITSMIQAEKKKSMKIMKGVDGDDGKGSRSKEVKLHPLFEFGYHHIVVAGTGMEGSIRSFVLYPNTFSTEIPNSGCGNNGLLGNVMQAVKHESLTKGITRLLVNGDRRTSGWFKNCLRVVVSEVVNNNNRKMIKDAHDYDEEDDGGRGTVAIRRDSIAEWWACVLWVEAEWLVTRANGNSIHLEKLFKVIDSIWRNHIQREKRCVEQPLFKAVYFVHRVRREIITTFADRVLTTPQLHKLINGASEALRESINLTEKEHTLQLVWTLVAEWILETRIELWEETEIANPEFCCQFSGDLDTLRGLCHHVPTSLPSLYLYEAALRLMSKASPGRTQQLLDASLRPPRLSNKHALLCVSGNNNNPLINNSGEDSNNEITTSDLESSSSDSPRSPSGSSCKSRRGNNWNNNLVREKRKALAMYLRCKHLPVHVITCPGEKAGMLRETIKLLEKFGDQRKINQCVEMIKSVV